MTTTPRPWYEGQLDMKGDVLAGPDGSEEVVCHASNGDAALIVRAVNHHDELVAALEHLTKRCDLAGFEWESLKEAREVLAKVTA